MVELKIKKIRVEKLFKIRVLEAGKGNPVFF